MVSWKDEIVDPADSTASKYGGKSLSYVLRYFKGLDLTTTVSTPEDIADISTPTYFASEILHLWDLDKSHSIKFQVPDYDENKTFTFPSEAATGPAEELVLKDAAQILTNKTIDFEDNTILNLTKGALPTIIFFTDQDNDIGEHYFDVRDYTGTVATPLSGRRRIFTDPTTGKLSIKRSDGAILSLEEGNLQFAGGFAAGGTVTISQTLSTNTIFTIAHGLSNEPDIVTVNAKSADAMASVFRYEKDATNITITYNTPPPTGTNNIQLLWGAAYVNPDPITFSATSVDTFQNKTINVDQNIIKHSTTNAAADLLTFQTDRYNRFPIGPAGKVLAVNGTGTGLEWITPSTSDITSTSTTTFTNKTIGDVLKLLKQGSTPGDPAANSAIVYVKAIDANNDGLFMKLKTAGVMQEWRLIP